MLSLRTRLDGFQSVFDGVFDRLIIADFEMQKGMMLDSAPVAAIKCFLSDEVETALAIISLSTINALSITTMSMRFIVKNAANFVRAIFGVEDTKGRCMVSATTVICSSSKRRLTRDQSQSTLTVDYY